MNLPERAEEIDRLFDEGRRHASCGELSEAIEHAQAAVTLMADQIAALNTGDEIT